MDPIKFTACPWQDISESVVNYVSENHITVDSFWEAHVLGSQHYRIEAQDGTFVGFFAIHQSQKLTLFHVVPTFGHLSQAIFERIKRFEQVTHAFVATGDEQFLSHALDNYTRLEKQAYFAIYTERDMVASRQQAVVLREALGTEDADFLKTAGDFFDQQGMDYVSRGSDFYKVYVVTGKETGELVGFGIVEYGRVDLGSASIGMYVCEHLRQQGYAGTILQRLKELVVAKGLEARSGCWYYNHNSKKSMEVAGAYSKTRLLKIYF